jgi:flavin-dependent dehydrogenase
MSRKHSLPALVIGGGIAGAAFALELARNGRRVTVLERTCGAHHKVCGEFLSEDAQAALTAVGLDVNALGAVPIQRFRLVKGESYATTTLPFVAAGLSRFRLDQALLAAAERAGAVIVRNTLVTGIESGNGPVLVKTERRVWKAAAVGLATGKHSLRGLSRRPGEMVGFKMHLAPTKAASQLIETVQLVFFRGGYIGACLVEGGILSIAWVMRAGLVRSVGGNWAAQKQYLARQSSLIGDLLANAQPILEKPVAVAAIPYGYLRSRQIASNIFPMGDQLAVVPSFTGDGIAIALHTGLTAARAVLADHDAETYQHQLVRCLRPQFRLAGAVGHVLGTPVTCAIGVAAARWFPSLITSIAAATRYGRLPRATSSPRIDELPDQEQ